MALKEGVFDFVWDDLEKSHQFKLSFILFQEEDTCILYCPVLDLSGYGYSQVEAEESFSIALEEFIACSFEKNTFYSELLQIGWQKTENNLLIPPPMDYVLRHNEHFREIFNTHDLQKKDYELKLPLAA